MLLAAHVNVATLAHDEDGQSRKRNEADEQFPHGVFPLKEERMAAFLPAKLTAA
ncbi:hypothetical protein [Kinneretia aquatilis]|uniref:hypothetical protein n=1 Tax=Kinneretia aquatilis TaxID=2070761 RepID=UPI002557FCB3|nr:hypothetical protein [Paucibacter aquatile]WIW00319.1 hypothetical protein K9V56_013805 [Paucibacter aquatile]